MPPELVEGRASTSSALILRRRCFKSPHWSDSWPSRSPVVVEKSAVVGILAVTLACGGGEVRSGRNFEQSSLVSARDLAAPRAQPEQHPPPVQWLRVNYAKRGRARFTSHRDFGRAFERALRRAAVPMAYSSGFSPHPRISYPNASPTGAASEAEYLEIGLAAACDPGKVRDALDAALPPGLDVVEVAVARPGALAEELTGSRWQVDIPGLPAATLQTARDEFLARDLVLVERMTKNGMRQFDARAAVVALEAEDGRLVLTLAHQVPLVRPDDVLAGLRAASPEFAPDEPPVLTRLTQGRLDPDSGVISEPGH
jgi:radical SAM-linked protein